MKKGLLITGASVLTLILAIVGYGLYMYFNVQNTVNTMHVTLDREKSEKRDMLADIGDPLSFLLVGIDAAESERGRADTLMVITVNPLNNSMKTVSIPRDTYTEIVGRGTEDKINHAYAFGGPEMTIATVENFLNIPIDYFVSVNMAGFKDIVDALGGITVENDMAFRQSGFDFEEGELFLTGEEALAFARMRQQDSRGDLGRNDRQRQIVAGIIEEGAQLSSITKLGDILDSFGTNVQTNLEFDNMRKLMQSYHQTRHNSETLEFTNWSGGRINGIWYMFQDEEEVLEISNTLRTHLGLEPEGASLVKADE